MSTGDRVDLEAALRAVVGEEHVLDDADLCASYETDWTRAFTGRARCVVRPASTAEVAAVARACSAAGVPMVVQGGNTGLVGGGVPGNGATGGSSGASSSGSSGASSSGSSRGTEVLISLTRLTGLEPVDTVAAQVTAGAGVTLEDLQAHVHAAGLDFGVDLAARATATVGGLVAANAGGIRVLRYGSMRTQVAGVEAVLADGTVLSRLAGLAKDNTGYDLAHLLTGSEGTLAIITRVRLRLVPMLTARAVALVALSGTEAALTLLSAARERLGSLSAAEVCYADGLELVRAHTRLPAPFAESYPAYLLLECSARTDPTDELLDLLGDVDVVEDATVATDTTSRNRLWEYRENHTEAINAAGVPTKLDICVPLPELPALVRRLPEAVASVAPDARTILFGHLNEGNVHVNVLYAAGRPADGQAAAVSDAVLRLVAEHAGSISSEHGVGRAKTRWLGLSRSPEEIAAMRGIKQALDPAGLLNPGVLLPTS